METKTREIQSQRVIVKYRGTFNTLSENRSQYKENMDGIKM